MPMPNLPVPLYPDVPDLPGVPPVLRDPSAVAPSAASTLLTADAIGVTQAAPAPVWGVFDSNRAPVAIADTVTALEYRSDSHISSYPQEKGAFGSYNKVQMPYASRVQLVCGRTAAERTAFLAAIDAAKQSTDLYTVASPEAIYSDANITGYDYSRQTRNGAALLIVNLHIEEVRQTGTAQMTYEDNTPTGSVTGKVRVNYFTSTANPASADAVSLGQVQAQTPGAGQAALFGPTSSVL